MITTWMCDACHEKRPDDNISVLTYSLKDCPGAERNFKYCNDKDECLKVASNNAGAGKI